VIELDVEFIMIQQILMPTTVTSMEAGATLRGLEAVMAVEAMEVVEDIMTWGATGLAMMEVLVEVLEEEGHLEEVDLVEDVVVLEEIRLVDLVTEEIVSGMMKEALLEAVVEVLMVQVALEDLDQEVEDSLEDLVEDRLEAEKIKTERKRRPK